jgi:hypothetical protein
MVPVKIDFERISPGRKGDAQGDLQRLLGFYAILGRIPAQFRNATFRF